MINGIYDNGKIPADLSKSIQVRMNVNSKKMYIYIDPHNETNKDSKE